MATIPALRFSVTRRHVIALVEANAQDRSALHELLSPLNADIKDFDSAESCLAASNGSFGCLITEMALPGMSGLDLLRRLRAAGITPPVILVGEEADVRAAVAAMREGAVDFIEKPLLDVAILKRVAYLLDHPAPLVH